MSLPAQDRFIYFHRLGPAAQDFADALWSRRTFTQNYVIGFLNARGRNGRNDWSKWITKGFKEARDTQARFAHDRLAGGRYRMIVEVSVPDVGSHGCWGSDDTGTIYEMSEYARARYEQSTDPNQCARSVVLRRR